MFNGSCLPAEDLNDYAQVTFHSGFMYASTFEEVTAVLPYS